MNLRCLQIVAPGVSSPLIISSGAFDNAPKIDRAGGLARADQGATAAGYIITSSTPDLYQYNVQTMLSRQDYIKYERILMAQDDSPRSVQYVDRLEPIHTSRINAAPGRTGFGPVQSSSEGNRQNFQSFCLLFNSTPSEEIEGYDGRENMFAVEFRLQEI